jgi:hypothetical protein
VTERQERRRKRLFNDLKESSRYWKLKVQAPDHRLWNRPLTCHKRDYGMSEQPCKCTMRLVNSLSTRRPECETRQVSLGFVVVDKVLVGQVFLRELWFLLSVSSYYALDKEVKSMLKCKNWRR